MLFKTEVLREAKTVRDYTTYGALEPQDFLRIHEQDLSELIRKANDYQHYASNYGCSEGVCETGYPQHPGYICGRCGQDRSAERKCLREYRK